MPTVIEIVKFKLTPGITATVFLPVDRAVKVHHVSKQPGFISRESATNESGEWLVIVHWKSVEDADASMTSFSSASSAQTFMSMIDVSTMTMQRYVTQ